MVAPVSTAADRSKLSERPSIPSWVCAGQDIANGSMNQIERGNCWRKDEDGAREHSPLDISQRHIALPEICGMR